MTRTAEETGDCCMARHIRAMMEPPQSSWTCDCLCHGRRDPEPLYPSPCCDVESTPADVTAYRLTLRCGQCGLVWQP